MRGLDLPCSERVVPFRHGTAFFHDSLSRVYDLNFLRVERGASAEELVADADLLQEGLGHRKLQVDDEELGGRLDPGFRGLGWTVNRHVIMPHRGPTPPADKAIVSETDLATLEPVWAEGIRGFPFGRDEEVVRQLLAEKRVIAAAVPTRYFAVLVDGTPVSYCELYSDGETAQIEAVLTHEAYRGRGFARAVVTRALAEARRGGNPLVFIVAVADDWPRELYRKLGFEPAGLKYHFLRELTAPRREPS
jgi:ribosomal protein S18 acetylase RimI-like enzyme